MLTDARRTAHSTRQDALRFAEADVDCDGKLSFPEFLSAQPQILRDKYGDDEIREWFAAADTDGNGNVSLNEWFFWSMSKAAARNSRGSTAQESMRAVFRAHDRNATGTLDAAEFQAVCDELGFGGFADEIFADLDRDRSGFIQYSEVIERVTSMIGEGTGAPTKLLMMTAAWVDAEKTNDATSAGAPPHTTIDTSGWELHASDAEALSDELRVRLRHAGLSVVELLPLFNQPQVGETASASDALEVDLSEFMWAMTRRFGFRGEARLLKDVFRSLDIDASGKIGFSELVRHPRRLERPHRASPQGLPTGLPGSHAASVRHTAPA